jgi:DNA replication protein DnaC
MLQEPMMEKLTAMRLLGMTDALKAQEQDPAARELSFLDRLGLLVDQQWTWRENQALARRLHAAKLKGASVEDIDYRASRGLDKSVIRALVQKSAWAEQHENVFVLGPTGVGKSFVACALAQKAAAMVTPHSICAPRRCSGISPSHELTGVCAVCWRA